jgi:chromosome segregation ATPase
MMTQKQLKELEEQAFYESGLSADGCLNNLDSYARESIQRYGRYLLKNNKESKKMSKKKLFLEDELNKANAEIEILKEEVRTADHYYIRLIKELTKLEEENKKEKNKDTVDEAKDSMNKLFDTIEQLREENKNLKQRLDDIKEGFEGCCYACEPVGILNKKLEAELKEIEEDGTEEHNAAFDLRRRLTETLVQNDQWKGVAKKLYSIVLHLQESSKRSSIVVAGSGLYSESVHAIKEYEELYGS